MTRELPRRVAAVAAVVIAGAATIATSQGVPSAFTDATFSVSLSPDHPFDIRRIAVVVRHSGILPSDVQLSVEPAEFAEEQGGYRLSLVPDDPQESRPDLYAPDSGDGTSMSMSILESCREDCDRSYTLVARLANLGGELATKELSARIVASYASGGLKTPLGATTAISIGPDEAATQDLATLRILATGQATVGADHLQDQWSGRLRVPAGALLEANFDRAIGGLWLTVDASPAGDDAAANVAISVKETYLLIQVLDSDYRREVAAFEWLSACEPDIDCTLPMLLEFAWEPRTDNAGHIPISGAVTLNWTVEATLEYLDRSEPPAGATLDLITEQ